MKDAAQLFGAPSPEAAKFSIDIFNFEKRIAEITPDNKYMNDPIKVNNKMKVRKWNFPRSNRRIRVVVGVLAITETNLNS